MNTARQMQRLSSPAAPLRVSALRSTARCSSTTPSNYRLLSVSTARSEAATSPALRSLSHQQRQPQPILRSTLPATAIRLDSLSPARTRAFHASARSLQAEGKEGKEKEEGKEEEPKKEKEESKKSKKDEMPPPPPHGDKTPWQVFIETMQNELKESKEWNESTKALASGAQQLAESESIRKAREAYEATSGVVSKTAATVVKTTAAVVGKSAKTVWETPVMKGVRKGANKTGEVLDKATKPIRETEAFKNVKNVIDDGSSSRYGGWTDKEERRRQKELREKMLKESGQAPQVFQEDPNAGTSLTVHKDAAWKEAWREFRDSSKFVQSLFNMKNVYRESDNPLIETARSITDKVASWFAENETAQVIKKVRQMDPSFKLESFLQELREYILPEVLDAYVKGDIETLKLWLSEAQFSVYEALTKQYLQAGLKSDGRILDIRGVDILRARILDPGEIPVFIVTCRTQEVHVYRNAKTNQLAAGMEDKVQLVTYAIGMTRIAEDVNNPETRGWRLIEMQKSGREWI